MEDKSGFGIGALVSFILMAILGIIFIPILLDMAQNNVVTSIVTVPVTSIVYEEPKNYNGYLQKDFEDFLLSLNDYGCDVTYLGNAYNLQCDALDLETYPFDADVPFYVYEVTIKDNNLCGYCYYGKAYIMVNFDPLVPTNWSFVFEWFEYDIPYSIVVNEVNPYTFDWAIIGQTNYPTPEPEMEPMSRFTPYDQQSCGNQCGVALYEEIVVFKKED